MEYYDAKRYWQRIRPHLAAPKVADTLVEDFNKFTYGRWRKLFMPGMVPHEFESCDWWLDHRGRLPAYWQYVKHAACHWLVNFNLELAQASVPNRVWRIVSSEDHSTVWDGGGKLFDLNGLALGIKPDDCYAMASGGEMLKPGEHLPVHFAPHYTTDMRAA